MPCNEEDRITEIERAVQVVVVQDDRRGEDNPNWNDSCSRNLRLWSGNLNGDWGRQRFVCVLLSGRKLIGRLDEWLLFETMVNGLSYGHGCICAGKVESDSADERGRLGVDVEEPNVQRS
jgi:hypothetical protein